MLVDASALHASGGLCSLNNRKRARMWPAGAGFGYLAYKRPRLAMFAGGLVAFTTLPYVSATARATCLAVLASVLASS
jgi:hypothetical protein